MPLVGGSEETAITGVERAPSERSAGGQVASRRDRELPEVRLRDDQHVGDFHDPRLQELQGVARAGLHDHHDRVGGLGHVGLGLPDADGLDHDHVEGHGQRVGGGGGGAGQAAEAFSGRAGADQHPAVGGVVVDPRAVSQ